MHVPEEDVRQIVALRKLPEGLVIDPYWDQSIAALCFEGKAEVRQRLTVVVPEATLDNFGLEMAVSRAVELLVDHFMHGTFPTLDALGAAPQIKLTSAMS